MKTFLQTLIYCTLISAVYAHNLQITDRTKNEWLKFNNTEQKSTINLMQDKATLKIAEDDRLIQLSSENDELGYRHTRIQQTYKNIAIEGAIYLMHKKNDKVTHANGKLVHNLNMSVTPSITEATALKAAFQHINATLYAWEDPVHQDLKKQVETSDEATFNPSGELVIIDPKYGIEAEKYRLAYKFDIYAVEPLSRNLVYVDAQTNEILTTVEKIHNCMDVVTTDLYTAIGTTNYSGDVVIIGCDDNGVYTLANNYGGGMQVFDAANTYSYPQIPFTAPPLAELVSDPTANEVHWATQNVYDYFLNTHNRNSLDNNEMPLLSWVHYGTDYNNAFWNGSWMTYGDGDNIKFSSLTSPDVVAHEMAHGITNFSANLNYLNESGALNESFSDIFGEVAERNMRGSNDWIIGADFTLLTDETGLRNMSNPNDPNVRNPQPDTYLGENWHTGAGDFGGVHINSGVQNYWFYLLSEGGTVVNDNSITSVINGIGMEKAADIVYRNLTTYLTSTSQYADARTGSIQAAIDLYGEGSDEAIQTEEAWCAVGIGCFTVACNRLNDSLALVALHNATDGANWTNIWDLNQPMDTWYGIELNENGCVTCIDLDGAPGCTIGNGGLNGNNLTGNIPAQLEDLSNLTILSLGRNNLSGNIPPQLGNLASLQSISLESNSLSGSIPSQLGNLSNLIKLDLSFNSLSGNIPIEFGNLISLNYLDAGSNELNGNIPIQLGNLNNLISLSLEANNLTSDIPDELGNLNNLERLWLYLNQLTGNIPVELGNLSKLTQLVLSNNQLSGNIPFELGNLTSLTKLGLSVNQLAGSIPPEIGYLTNLQDLGLSENQFTDRIPFEFKNLIRLEFLRLGDNFLIGHIPPELGYLSNLMYLELSNNQLNNCYDDILANLCPQLGIYSTNNYISNNNNFDATWEDFCATNAGECPNTCRYTDSLALVTLYNSTDGANWANTWDLNQPMDTWYGVTLNADGCVTELVLSGNQLSGNIPPEIGNLSSLTKLWLANNQLSGNIPSELGNLTNLGNLILGNNQLTGNIPPELGNLNLWYVDIGFNQLSGCYHSNLSNLCVNDYPNWVIESGNNFDATFENFCLNEDGTCNNIVWPGDFNNDGIANNTDLLQWGLAEASTGEVRPNANLNWTAQDCPDWQSYINSINVKHADGDGNGIVNIDDLQALITNYGNTHAATSNTYSESPLEFRLEPISNSIINGEIAIEYELYIESSLGTPVNLHGVACRINFDGDFNSAALDLTNSVLQPEEHIELFDDTQKLYDIAFTRIDKNNRLCNDALAIIIIIPEDIPSGETFELDIDNGNTISANGNFMGVNGSTLTSFSPGVSVAAEFSVAVSATHSQCNNLSRATVMPIGDTGPYTYLWSTGETTAQVNNLSVGSHNVTVTDVNGETKPITFNTKWAFTPVEVNTTNTEICIDFTETTLSEPVQVSIDNGVNYQSPITSSTCYSAALGSHHVWIKRVADDCPIDLGLVSVEAECNTLVNFTGLPFSTASSTPIALTGSPSGGEFTGPGVVFSAFNPSLAGLGNHEISYTYTDENGCSLSVEQTVFVFSIDFNFINYNLGFISPKITESPIMIENMEPTNEEDSYTFEIMNVEGKILHRRLLEIQNLIHTTNLDIPNLESGFYIIRFYNAHEQISEKFVISR